jgi:hypothetical protein
MPDGEEVYLGLDISFWVDTHVTVNYEKMRLRKEVVDTLEAQGGVATFTAGTHLGYGANAIQVVDWSVDKGKYFHAVNPFAHFTDEKQQELLTIYAPLYERYKTEGVRAFTDITESRLWWDRQGSIEGSWSKTDAPSPGYDDTANWWRSISIVSPDYLNAETYWRVLDHPWNKENNYVGMYIENDTEYRFYLLDGDLSSGVAMAILDSEYMAEDDPVWRPLRPETATNHPSVGKRHYFRFEVEGKRNMWNESLTIERFSSIEAARAGFTDRAVEYRRGLR